MSKKSRQLNYHLIEMVNQIAEGKGQDLIVNSLPATGAEGEIKILHVASAVTQVTSIADLVVGKQFTFNSDGTHTFNLAVENYITASEITDVTGTSTQSTASFPAKTFGSVSKYGNSYLNTMSVEGGQYSQVTFYSLNQAISFKFKFASLMGNISEMFPYMTYMSDERYDLYTWHTNQWQRIDNDTKEKVVYDDTLSATSTNAVQNRVLKTALENAGLPKTNYSPSPGPMVETWFAAAGGTSVGQTVAFINSSMPGIGVISKPSYNTYNFIMLCTDGTVYQDSNLAGNVTFYEIPTTKILPKLPSDASSKTYVMKAVNGTLTWVLDA